MDKETQATPAPAKAGKEIARPGLSSAKIDLFQGLTSEATNPVDRKVAEMRESGFSDEFIIRYFAGGDDAEFRKGLRDDSNAEHYWQERQRIIKLINGPVEPMWANSPPEDGDNTITEKEAAKKFERYFGMSPDSAFRGDREYRADYAKTQRHEMLKWMQEFMGGKNKNQKLFIQGGAQRGKTYNLRLIGANLIKRGCDIAYINCQSICTDIEIQRQFKSLQMLDKNNSKINHAKNADFTIIDDLGVEPMRFRDDLERQLYLILEYRNPRNKPTIIATNLTSDDLKNTYGDRTVGRIATGGMQIVSYATVKPFENWSQNEKA